MPTPTLHHVLASALEENRTALQALLDAVSREPLGALQSCLAAVPFDLSEEEPDAVDEIRLVAWRRVCSEAWPPEANDADAMLAHWLAFAEAEGLVDGDTYTFLATRALLAAPSAESALDTYLQYVASHDYAYTDATLADVALVAIGNAAKARLYLLSAIAEYWQVARYLPKPAFEVQLRTWLAAARDCGATANDYGEVVAWVEARTGRASAPDLFERFV